MDLPKLFDSAGAAGWGQLAYEDLKACMTGAAQGRAAELLGREPQGVFVAAFPYYADEGGGNLSQYARGRDYHIAVTQRLDAVCDALRKDYPDLWALMLKWDADSPVTFKADGHTVHDYDRRFALEDDGMILPDEPFRWSMLNEELNYRLF